MSEWGIRRKRDDSSKASWTSIAFIVEAMLLLVFLTVSIAVFVRVFSWSLNTSVESRTLDAATIAASSVAEHFAADPESVREETNLGDLVVRCLVTPEQRADGILYHAQINVFSTASSSADPVYTIETSSFQAGGA